MSGFPIAIDGRFVDGESDHIKRKTLELERVNHMLIKYSINPNSNSIENEWVALDLNVKYDGFTQGTYEYCICGHEIQNNIIARNIYNHNMIILGSECIRKCDIKITKKYCEQCFTPMYKSRKTLCDDCNPTLKCDVCGDRKKGKSSYCEDCKYGYTQYINKNRNNETTWTNMLITNKDYCRWVLRTEFKPDSLYDRFKIWLENYDLD